MRFRMRRLDMFFRLRPYCSFHVFSYGQLSHILRTSEDSFLRQGKIMTDSIPDASVALSLMLEALSLLDGPEHSKAAAYLRDAIDELSPQKQQEPSSPRGA